MKNSCSFLKKYKHMKIKNQPLTLKQKEEKNEIDPWKIEVAKNNTHVGEI